jgi:putative transposase
MLSVSCPQCGFERRSFALERTHTHLACRCQRICDEHPRALRVCWLSPLPTRQPLPLDTPSALNAIWSLDFMHDTLYDGRRFRTLNVLDDGNREALGIEVSTSIPSQRVIRMMEQLIELHGRPAALRLDNGSELTSHAFVDWAKEREIELRFIQPGKPNQNAFIERFNRTYRTEVLNAYAFESIEQVQQITDAWLIEYNEERPHDALGRVPPLTYLPRETTTGESSFKLST